MKVKRYKNGNITIQRVTPMEELTMEERNLLIAIAWNVPDMDLLGEQGCAGNYDMYQCFYNYHTDKKYMVLLSEQEKFEEGKVIKLYAQELDEEDREELNKI
jgi:hypothetical protein